MKNAARITITLGVSALVSTSLMNVACQRSEPAAFVKGARLGVFFGGQVEERREIPFELDPGKQSQGFRVEFTERLAADTDVDWRIDMPNTEAHRHRARSDPPPAPTATLSGRDVARAGETTLDHVLTFHPGDPLGLWNVRVVVHGKVVIDRPVEIYDAALRKRLTPPDAG